jgi:hypothetical protein
MQNQNEWARMRFIRNILATGTIAVFFVASGAMTASATEPCDDFGECKMLIEVNATDGDIGFHFLADGDDLNALRIFDPNGEKIFDLSNRNALREQKTTEVFSESAEPLCWPDPEADEDDEIVTLAEFLDRWTPGTYTLRGWSDSGEKSSGETELTFALPAAPKDLEYDDGEISWAPGDDLGNCATSAELDDLVTDGKLPVHPENVPVDVWEAVLEADDGSNLKFTIRVPPGTTSVTVPDEFIDSLPDNTPAKIEVGAIGGGDNATFSEVGDICLNETTGCED